MTHERKLAGLLGVIYAMSKCLPQKTLITIYKSLVLPVITNNIIIWGGACNTHINPIIIKINKILRIILKVKFNENRIPLMPTNAMYCSLNFLKFEDLYKFNLLKFLHFIMFIDNAVYLKYFTPLLPSHNYNTRNVRINLPAIRIELEKISTIYNICNLIK